jgi:hypothetical protein
MIYPAARLHAALPNLTPSRRGGVFSAGAWAVTGTMGWDTEFSEPILLPKGKKLPTRRDAAIFITKLPKAEHDAEPWQAAIEVLLLVADLGGPTMFARIGIMRAVNRNQVREFNPDRQPHHWGKRKLKRDQ